MAVPTVLPSQLSLEEAVASYSEGLTAVSTGLHLLMAMVLKFMPCTGIRWKTHSNTDCLAFPKPCGSVRLWWSEDLHF